ncbi:hypothetical protein FQA47_024126 [Oryzias melastigma]|uniref:Uncharacterized protein n=1 Tax=Oryzias melastigma TaxID=30732 RepID=A0A834CVF9_ORYME|nr:hypothetical protein FQA47_024126 [Oryzias melastigma]
MDDLLDTPNAALLYLSKSQEKPAHWTARMRFKDGYGFSTLKVIHSSLYELIPLLPVKCFLMGRTCDKCSAATKGFGLVAEFTDLNPTLVGLDVFLWNRLAVTQLAFPSAISPTSGSSWSQERDIIMAL